jgi:hypothetical protein
MRDTEVPGLSYVEPIQRTAKLTQPSQFRTPSLLRVRAQLIPRLQPVTRILRRPNVVGVCSDRIIVLQTNGVCAVHAPGFVFVEYCIAMDKSPTSRSSHPFCS